MGQTATNLGVAAVKEGQRCFDVPLDTTMQNVRQPPGSRSGNPDQFYALSLGTGTDGLAPTCQHPTSMPMNSMHSVASNAPTVPSGALTQGYPRHGDPPMGTEQMLQAQSFPHSEPFYEGPVNGGYIEEPASARDLDDMADLYSQPPTNPTLPPPNWNTQSSPAPPPPPPPRTNSTQNMPYQPPPSSHTQASPTLQAPPPVAAQQAGNTEAQRNLWTQGSILEIFSASSNRWYPALLLKVAKGDGTPDVLTMQFWLSTDEAKQKSLYRSDAQQLAVLGTNLGGELPPGFCLKPSASRPGQSVYLDQTTGMKYQTAELAWQTYFKRLLERPSAGMETVCQLPGAQSMAVTSQQHRQTPTDSYAHRTPPAQQERANIVAAGLTTEYEVDTSAPQTGQLQQRQQQNQMQYQQRLPEGPRMAPPQSSGAMISRLQVPTSGQLGATAETRHGAQLAAELNKHLPAHGNAPEGPQVNFQRAIRA